MVLSRICKLKEGIKIDTQKTRAPRSKGLRRRYLDPNSNRMLKTSFFPKIKKTAIGYGELGGGGFSKCLNKNGQVI